MIKRLFCLLALLPFCGFAVNSVAEPKLKPGLWEHSFEVSSESGRIEAALTQARQMLESMPAQYRQMVEQQLAASGISLDLQNSKARVCVSEDQAARNEFPDPNDSCSQTVTEQGKGVYKIVFRCEGNPPVTGEGEMRMISDKEYRGSVIFNTNIDGQDERMEARQNGIWLSADCNQS